MSEKLVHVTPSLDTGATSRAERSSCFGTLWGIHVRLLCAARRPGRPLQPENFRNVLTALNRSAWGFLATLNSGLLEIPVWNASMLIYYYIAGHLQITCDWPGVDSQASAI